MAHNKSEVAQRYQSALAELTEQLKRDHTIVATILCGSLSHDEVWEKSDIDLMVVCTEDLKAIKHLTLVVDGIYVHAIMQPRAKFKTSIQSALQSSFFHSLFSKSTLLFSHDDTIAELYENIHHLGARDRDIQLLHAATCVIPSLTKAEKWFHVKKDVHYSFLWIMKTIEALAQVEVLQAGEITGREVLQQAMKHNPQFFSTIYNGLIDGKKTPKTIEAALQEINTYLVEHVWVFQPILDFLHEARGVRSATEIDHYFANQMGIEGASFSCEWLAAAGVIEQVASPVRLTTKSRVEVEEAAYYYGADEA